jgi:adenylosuccinate synthase
VKSFLLAGYSCLNLTKLDVMTGIPGGKIKLAIDYKHEGKVWL